MWFCSGSSRCSCDAGLMKPLLSLPLSAQSCPCGDGRHYDECCGPIIGGRRQADTAEQLMRSRYTAYTKDEVDYLLHSWHPTTRPGSLGPTPQIVWQSLQILDVFGGGSRDSSGRVHFIAAYDNNGVRSALNEASDFERYEGRWVYVNGTQYPDPHQ